MAENTDELYYEINFILNEKSVQSIKSELEKKIEAFRKGKSYMELDRNEVAEFARKTADVLIKFDKGLPDLDFFKSDKFEFQTLEIAKSFFLTWFR